MLDARGIYFLVAMIVVVSGGDVSISVVFRVLQA